MIRDLLKDLVVKAIASAQAAGDLPAFEIPPFSLDHPRQSEMGDYAVSVAMQLARIAKLPPPQIAQRVAKHLENLRLFESLSADLRFYEVTVVAAFINIKLTPAYLSSQVEAVLSANASWGNINLGKGRKAQVEHGSANPTGFATIGTGRNVITGDTLANTLEAAGYDVHREWYMNDAGTQIRTFGESLFAHYARSFGQDAPLPPKAYEGEDVVRIAHLIKQREGDAYLHMPKPEAIRAIRKVGIDEVMANIKLTMARLNIHHDNFFSEESLYSSGMADEMLDGLRQRGLIIEHEGAQWFSEDGSPIRAGQGRKQSSADYAEEMGEHGEMSESNEGQDVEEKGKKLPVQAVVIRSARVIADPEDRATYFASDIPYAWNKVMLRGFNPAVYVWGEDHQADVPRVLAAAKAIGIPDGAVRIVIYRFITLLRDGQEVRMGKRKGNAIWIDDVIDEMGVDAFRYVMLSRSVDTKFVFDIGVLKEQNDKNPVFYVQYAHARIASIFRKAEEEGWAVNRNATVNLTEPSELMLMRKILELPEIIEQVAMSLQPHTYTTYARELGQAFSKFYDECRIKDSAPDVAGSRLKLAQAAQLTLARVLTLMGMSTPERM